MSIWAKKRLSIFESHSALDIFERLFKALGQPVDMMMVAANKAWSSEHQAQAEDIIIQLPHPRLLASFPGFEEIPESELPTEASGLIAHNAEFLKRFRPLSGR